MQRIIRILPYITGAGALLITFLSSAESLPPGMPDGGCWANPMNALTVGISPSGFPSNLKGATSTSPYSTTPAWYDAWCYHTKESSAQHRPTSYFSSDPSGFEPAGDDFYKLSDDVDFKLLVKLQAITTPAPFLEVYDASANAGSDSQGVTALYQGSAGSTGSVTFRLRRDIIGGAFYFPGGIKLGNLYRYTYKGQKATIPILEWYTTPSVIPIPTECTINGGANISVKFTNIDPDVMSSSAETSIYRVSKELSYACKSSITRSVKINFVGGSAGFGNALKTSDNNIGVALTIGGRVIPPYGSFVTQMYQGKGRDSIYFVAIKRPQSTPAIGKWTANATLVITDL